ncbi:hypothetical protein ACGFZP_31300 [Kitasatospora sp. NPDC048239]|uniref:hypothetical protein n=1 Tax=Kitasatospora sp. NPDC048239 TaxID=3364046 RepID=UPI0037177E5E
MNKRASVGAVLGATLLATAAAVHPAAAAGNLIANGTFSKPTAPAGGYVEFDAGEDIGGAWLVSGPNKKSGVTLYSTGLTRYTYQAVDIGAGAISQDFDVDRGAVVDVTWRHARNTDPACATAMGEQDYGVQVFSTGSVPVDASFTPNGTRFTPVGNQRFIANDEHYTLEFTGRSPGGCGPEITEVVAKVIGYVGH